MASLVEAGDHDPALPSWKAAARPDDRRRKGDDREADGERGRLVKPHVDS
jgi:hypothetical protein